MTAARYAMPGRRMALRRWSRVLAGLLLLAVAVASWQDPLSDAFTSASRPRPRAPSVERSASPALAPAPTKQETPGLPAEYDESRLGEKVRWLFEEDELKPEDWDVLLLDQTYEKKKNTVPRVASCLVAVLGMAVATASVKALQAKEHFFAVVATTTWEDAVKKAKLLQSRDLSARVIPGRYPVQDIPEGEDSVADSGSQSARDSGTA